MTAKIKIGVSSCLLGNPVRYDGGHKHDRYITDILGRYFDLIPVCPEVECGLPVPRETLRLVGCPDSPRLICAGTGADLTGQMLEFCSRRVEELKAAGLCGFIFKNNSPSSGLYRVKVYGESGTALRKGRGLFAAAFAGRFPLLPLEEEGRLRVEAVRENFIERIFCCHRWNEFTSNRAGCKELNGFHNRHKLQVMAHSPKLLAAMGRLVASGRGLPADELFSAYFKLLMTALAFRATVKKNAGVLYRISSYFKDLNSPGEQAELVDLIGRYASQSAPLVEPLTLSRHYARKYKIASLAGQTYLEPQPAELILRNYARVAKKE